MVRKRSAIVLGALLLLSLPIGRLPAGASSGDFLRDCVAERNRLGVLFLIDESSSLAKSSTGNGPGSDPDGLRADAVSRAVSSLALNSIGAQGESREIQVQIAVFGSTYTSLLPWTPLQELTGDRLVSTTEELRKRNTAKRTDYRAGLNGAERDLVELERVSGQPWCKLLIWFTDGVLYLGSDERAAQNAKSEICASEGVAARLRSQGVFMFGVGLTGDAQGSDFDFFQSVVVGGPGCSSGSNGTGPVGEFVRIDRIDGLIGSLESLFPGAGTATPCPDPAGQSTCHEIRLTVEDLTNTLRLQVLVPSGSTSVQLIGPDGSERDLWEGSAFVSGVGGVQTQVVGPGSARLKISTSGLAGEWAVQVRGPNAVDTRVSVFSEASVRLRDADRVAVDPTNPTPFEVSIDDPDLLGLVMSDPTSAQPLRLQASLDVSARFGSKEVAVSAAPLEGLRFAVSWSGSLESVASTGRLLFKPTGSIGGIPVVFPESSIDALIAPAPDFPTIEGVSATQIDGSGSSEVTLRLRGPKDAGGEVFVPGSNLEVLSAPAGKEGLRVEVAESARLQLAQGSSGELSIRVTPEFEGNGRLVGEFVVLLLNDRGTEVPTRVSIEINMTKPFETATFLWILVGMVALLVLFQAGLVVPSALAMSRTSPLPVYTRTADVNLQVRADGRLSPSGRDLRAALGNDRNIGESKPAAASVNIAGFVFRGFPLVTLSRMIRGSRLSTFAKSNPDDPNEICLGPDGELTRGGQVWAAVPPRLTGTWVLSTSKGAVASVVRDERDAFDARLLVILPLDSGTRDEFIDSLESELDGVVDRLRSVVRVKTGGSTTPGPDIPGQPPPPSSPPDPTDIYR